MADNVSPAVIALPIVKWGLMSDIMRSREKILSELPVWVVVSVLTFAPEVC